MANHKATKKDARQNEKRRERNKYYGKTMRNAYRKMLASTKTEAEEMLPKVVAMLDKLAKRNVIHRNKAANLKSAAYKNIQAMA
jgi:small subunit ribosomal protein S20